MQQYLNVMQHVLDNGAQKGDRTGTGTLSVFGHQMRFDLFRRLPNGHHQKTASENLLFMNLSGSSTVTPISNT